jgi:two-component system, sensor histidine kinase and response regulator
MAREKELLIELGDRIRTLRKEKGFSQEELSYRAELHRTYIGMIERGEKNFSISNFVKIAKALDVESCLLLHNLFSYSPSLFTDTKRVSKKAKVMNSELFLKNEEYCENECVNNNRIFKLITDKSFDIIHVLNKNGDILFENAATQRILGYIPGNRVGLNAFEFVHPDDKEQLLAEFQDLADNPYSSKLVELRFQHENGSWVWFETCGQNFLENPYINGILINSRVINDRKQSQNELMQMTSTLEELNDTKDKFFSILAHDLKSSFQYILGYSKLLSDDAEEMRKEDIKGFAGHIHLSTKNTLSLLDNLLNWAEVQQGQISCSPEFLCLKTLIKESIPHFSYQSEAKNIKVINLINNGITIYADKFMLETIIRNLVSNAIKFSHKNGEIVLAAMAKETFVQIEVTDFGVGMDEETQKNLFKAGKIKSRKGTNGEKGTGIGLLLCNEFLDKIGGVLLVESQTNKGSKFVVQLPYAVKTKQKARINNSETKDVV